MVSNGLLSLLLASVITADNELNIGRRHIPRTPVVLAPTGRKSKGEEEQQSSIIAAEEKREMRRRKRCGI